MGSELYPWPRKFKITKTLSYPLRVNPNEPVNHLDRQMPHRKPYLDGWRWGSAGMIVIMRCFSLNTDKVVLDFPSESVLKFFYLRTCKRGRATLEVIPEHHTRCRTRKSPRHRAKSVTRPNLIQNFNKEHTQRE